MKVVRNTLAIRALSDHPQMKAPLEKELVGTNAVVFVYSDPSAAAKALQNFGKDVEVFQVKSGALDGQLLDSKAVKVLSELPGKDELRAMLLGVFSAPMTSSLEPLKLFLVGSYVH